MNRVGPINIVSTVGTQHEGTHHFCLIGFRILETLENELPHFFRFYCVWLELV